MDCWTWRQKTRRSYSCAPIPSRRSGRRHSQTSTRTRLFDVGIAEQAGVAFSAGLAACGLRPFFGTYAGFITMRACEQVRTFVAYPELQVKFIGINGGIHGGEREGVTHQFFEDLAILRSIPGMEIVVPADAGQARKATRAIGQRPAPAICGWAAAGSR